VAAAKAKGELAAAKVCGNPVAMAKADRRRRLSDAGHDADKNSESDDNPRTLKRKRANAARRLARKSLPSKQKLATQTQDAAAHRIARGFLPAEQKLATQAENAAAHRIARGFLSAEQKLATQAQNAAAHRIARECLPPKQRLLDKAARREASFEKRTTRKARCAQQVLDGSVMVQPHDAGNCGAKTCNHCEAMLWADELNSICCSNGKIQVEPFPESTPRLKELLQGDNIDSKCFKRHIRSVNQALSFASLTVRHTVPIWAKCSGAYNPNIVIAGRAYYNLGTAEPLPGDAPRNAQLYVHDPDDADSEYDLRAALIDQFVPVSTSMSERARLKRIMQELQNELHDVNPYVQFFQHLSNVKHEHPARKLALSERDLPVNSTRRYTSHGSPEVAVLVEDDAGNRDIVVHLQGGGVQRIPDTHRAVDPLYFVLLHPTGHPGWRLGLQQSNGRRLTGDKYYGYLLFERASHSTSHFHASRLFQEYCCLMFAKTENQRLQWQKFNQKTLRADLYQNVMDHLHKDDAGAADGQHHLGKRVILSPTFVGSPRYLHQRYQDAMAVVRKYRKPDLFITFTCNPEWTEITNALTSPQTYRDRPDLVARVFKLKLRAFCDELNKDGIFGRRIAHFMVVEFQKRGLPHAHILLILASADQLRSAQDIDDCICAELPPDPKNFKDGSMEQQQAQRLQDVIVKQQVHGPCGDENPWCPCMYDNSGQHLESCSKGYPMQFQTTTIWDESAKHPLYRRRSTQQGGRQISVPCKYSPGGTRLLDNRWVVPYNPYLSARYFCHVNVEACISPYTAKYLYKYLMKGDLESGSKLLIRWFRR
jgi:hypothetical protein